MCEIANQIFEQSAHIVTLNIDWHKYQHVSTTTFWLRMWYDMANDLVYQIQ